MVALLKAKSKVTIKQKPRVKYPIKNLFKRPKTESGLASSQTQPQATAPSNQINSTSQSQDILRVADMWKPESKET